MQKNLYAMPGLHEELLVHTGSSFSEKYTSSVAPKLFHFYCIKQVLGHIE